MFLDADLVESVRSSEVSKPLKANKSRCFNVVGCSTLAAWFHKKQHRR
ncbi:general secretion pathway protein GspH [Vibrio metoecus]|nr:general secretion pathway protein GspH [Vibrio cholerae]PAR36309.1 general secretion pathway protein GspH [Vibrio metoecus]PAR54511.1 general secretion pathway protein GspH [Vibrio metoecus]